MANNLDLNYKRVKFQNLGDTKAVYVNEGYVRQTGVEDGAVNSTFEFTYIYSADGTPRKIPASNLVSMYYANGSLSSDRVIDTNGHSFTIKGLTQTVNSFENYKIMLQDSTGKMSVTDSEKFINNITVKTEW